MQVSLLQVMHCTIISVGKGKILLLPFCKLFKRYILSSGPFPSLPSPQLLWMCGFAKGGPIIVVVVMIISFLEAPCRGERVGYKCNK